MKIYELHPITGAKSFYGKARVCVADDGTETLISYVTPVMQRTPDGKLRRLWDSWSATTGRHIAAFCGLNKAAYMRMPVESAV